MTPIKRAIAEEGLLLRQSNRQSVSWILVQQQVRTGDNSLGNGEKPLERHLVEKPHVVTKPCDELLSGGMELGWRNQQLVQERRMGGEDGSVGCVEEREV